MVNVTIWTRKILHVFHPAVYELLYSFFRRLKLWKISGCHGTSVVVVAIFTPCDGYTRQHGGRPFNYRTSTLCPSPELNVSSINTVSSTKLCSRLIPCSVKEPTEIWHFRQYLLPGSLRDNLRRVEAASMTIEHLIRAAISHDHFPVSRGKSRLLFMYQRANSTY
jgi:hypothetical protein